MKSLILYSTILGGFYAQSEALTKAVNAARHEAGEDLWKRGYSGNDPKGSTLIAKKYFRVENIEAIVPEGELQHVGFVTNRDTARNVYPKLRVGLTALDGVQFLLSLDVKTDVAQRLIGKLDNCFPGQPIKVSAWPTTVQRDGRTFVNHAVSVKGFDGKEIPTNSAFSASVKEICNGVEVALKSAGIADKKVIATAKATRRVDAYKDMLIKIQSVFLVAAPTV